MMRQIYHGSDDVDNFEDFRSNLKQISLDEAIQIAGLLWIGITQENKIVIECPVKQSREGVLLLIPPCYDTIRITEGKEQATMNEINVVMSTVK